MFGWGDVEDNIMFGWGDVEDINIDRALPDSTADELVDGCEDSAGAGDETTPGENDGDGDDGDRLETRLGLLSRPEDSDEDIFVAFPRSENRLQV